MSDIDIHHLAAAYALDAVDERERAAFEAHYPSCDVCRVDVVEFRETLARLAAADATPPPAAVKDRVMDEIGRTRQLSPLLPDGVTELAERRRRRRRGIATTLAVAAGTVGVVASGVVVLGGDDDEPAYADALAEVLASPDAQVVDLDSPVGADGALRVAWSPSEGRAVVIGQGLDVAPDGEAYELWLIGTDGAPVPMDLLDPASGGDIGEVVDIDAAPATWAVTIEPDGGSAAPTGEILFAAQV
jgi:anti-sigma-K factor RskA